MRARFAAHARVQRPAMHADFESGKRQKMRAKSSVRVERGAAPRMRAMPARAAARVLPKVRGVMKCRSECACYAKHLTTNVVA